jgi:nucleotide-binding universal stress UspA family protein
VDPGEPGRPVVVAVGTDSDGRAVDWGAAEAAARGCRLLVVHVEPLRWAVDPSGLVPVDIASYRLAAEEVLRAAVRRARAVAPDLDISAEAMFGCTVPLVASQGRRAQLLVLGGGTPRFGAGARTLLDPSVCGAVARREGCPVAVVRSLRSGPCAGRPSRVVVGVTGTGTSTAALDVAFQAAAQRGLPVTAVHAWTPDVPADHEGVCGPHIAAEERERRAVDRVLQPWRCRFRDVPVETQLSHADPASALVRESEGAALVVVGCRAHGAARAALSGSVGRSLLRRARCPVVVVREARVPGWRSWRRRRADRRADATSPLGDPTGTEPVRDRRASWE